jgi:aminoacyl-tRNA hydrolase
MSTGQLSDTRVIAIKPTTFMNLSGEAVQAVVHFYKIHPDQIIVVHDELDIDFGQIRLRKGGSAAGHNGIKSVTSTSARITAGCASASAPRHRNRLIAPTSSYRSSARTSRSSYRHGAGSDSRAQ